MIRKKQKKAPQYFTGARTEVATFLPARCQRVLEIGCGAGGFRDNIRTPCEYWGIEPAAVPAARAAQRMDRVLAGTFDAVRAQLPENYFDLVICNDVIEHLPDHDAFLQQIKTYMAPDSCLVGSVPNVRCYQHLYEVLFERDWRYRAEGILDRTHLRFFTQKSLKRTFAENGYRIEAFAGINNLAPARFTSPKKIRRWLTVTLLALLTLGLFNDIRYLQFGFRVRS